MNRSTFRTVKYVNGSVFSKARYTNGVGFEIQARTPVPQFPQVTPTPPRARPFLLKCDFIVCSNCKNLDYLGPLGNGSTLEWTISELI